jgi:hypothetical protein
VQVAVSDGYAYVADYHDLQVVDVTDPHNPQVVASMKTAGFAWGVFVSDGVLYVGEEYWDGCEAVDITDPLQPRVLGAIKLQGPCYSVAASGTLVYVSICDYGLQVVDFTYPQTPRILGSSCMPSSSRTYGVTVSGNFAWLTGDYPYPDPHGFVEVVDVTHPESPPVSGNLDFPGCPGDVAVSETYAYVALRCSSGLQIVDVSDPRRPALKGSVVTGGSPAGVAVSGVLGCLAAGDRGLIVVDVSSPSDPRSLVRAMPICPRRDVAGSYAYLACAEVGVDSGCGSSTSGSGCSRAGRQREHVRGRLRRRGLGRICLSGNL